MYAIILQIYHYQSSEPPPNFVQLQHPQLKAHPALLLGD